MHHARICLANSAALAICQKELKATSAFIVYIDRPTSSDASTLGPWNAQHHGQSRVMAPAKIKIQSESHRQMIFYPILFPSNLLTLSSLFSPISPSCLSKSSSLGKVARALAKVSELVLFRTSRITAHLHYFAAGGPC